MKIGDLVELSARGKTLKSNSSFLGEVGVVLEVMGNGYYDLGVRWFSKKLKTDKKCP